MGQSGKLGLAVPADLQMLGVPGVLAVPEVLKVLRVLVLLWQRSNGENSLSVFKQTRMQTKHTQSILGTCGGRVLVTLNQKVPVFTTLSSTSQPTTSFYSFPCKDT